MSGVRLCWLYTLPSIINLKLYSLPSEACRVGVYSERSMVVDTIRGILVCTTYQISFPDCA